MEACHQNARKFIYWICLTCFSEEIYLFFITDSCRNNWLLRFNLYKQPLLTILTYISRIKISSVQFFSFIESRSPQIFPRVHFKKTWHKLFRWEVIWCYILQYETLNVNKQSDKLSLFPLSYTCSFCFGTLAFLYSPNDMNILWKRDQWARSNITSGCKHFQYTVFSRLRMVT